MTSEPTHILDANILLRWVIRDVPVQSEAAEKFIAKAASKSLLVPEPVVVEAVYVMEKVYRYERESIAQVVKFVLNHPAIVSERALMIAALDLYQTAPISFVDAYLCSRQARDGVPLVTFDQRLKRYAAVQEPPAA